VRLNAIVSGSGRPILVLHGLFGSAGNWQSIARSLAPSFSVHALDLRNHGASPWFTDMGYPAMAADVATHMNNELVGRVHVLGRERAPRSFAAAMTSEIHRRERESDFEVVDTITVIMRYFEHFFEHELGDSMLQ
jgi:pimeloyl-ACP methyl ester carboxylesterase